MQLQSCNSSSDIIAVLHDKVNEFDQARNHNERLSSWLNPTINVLYAFFVAPGEGIGLIFSPAKVISASVGVLLLAAMDVDASQEALADLFEHLENIFKRLKSYTEVLSTNAMTDIIVKIMAKVLNIFTIAMKEMKQGRAKRFLRKLVGRKNIEDALKRLDKLTQEEAEMAVAQILNLTHGVDDKVTDVRNQLRDVDDKIHVVMKDGKDAKVVLQQTSNNVDDIRFIQDTVKLPEAGLALMAYFYFDFRVLDKQCCRNLLPSLLIQPSDQSPHCCNILSRLYSAQGNDLETMMKRWRDEDKKMIVETLSEKADGMFRWLYCQLDALRHCLPSSVRRTLDELPESLDETYERIVMDIKKGNRADAHQLLTFDFDGAKEGIPKLHSKWRWEDHEQEVVQFSHFLVKEFLLSNRLATSTKDISRYHIVVEDANTLIARACLGFLLRDPVDEIDAATAPLAEYVAKHWVAHGQVENVASRIRDGMEYLFDPEMPFFSAWAKLYDVDRMITLKHPLETKIQQVAPIYYAAYCGFHEIVEHLGLKYPQYASAIGGSMGTALHMASFIGHIGVVRSLLKCGADVDPQGFVIDRDWNLRRSMGTLMLSNSQDEHHWTPLSLAAHQGHVEIVQVLLEHNADVNSQSDDGWIPIQAAMVRRLLEHGANPNPWDQKRRTPLHLVLSLDLKSSYQLEVVRILLAHGAGVDAEDEWGMTPLQVALAEGQDEIAQLLSEYCSK
ncbi:hypothetical protein EDB87DRAFT_1581794 [Lactarius vividus]|nr:hypothetical protein EDB87DRAFT_1581794 [Lactarius vividus]